MEVALASARTVHTVGSALIVQGAGILAVLVDEDTTDHDCDEALHVMEQRVAPDAMGEWFVWAAESGRVYDVFCVEHS